MNNITYIIRFACLGLLALPAIGFSQETQRSTLAGRWNVKVLLSNGKTDTVQWNVLERDDGFEVKHNSMTFLFTKRGRGGAKQNFDFICTLKGVGQINHGKCSFDPESGVFEGTASEEHGPRELWTATRGGGSHAIPEGLYIQAGEATVKRGAKVSIPLYLRYNGHGEPPMVANMNFDVTYTAQVATVRPHPNPAKQATARANEQPELPRGNLLTGGVLIAGNTKERGTVRVGFAGKKGVKPGTGKPGETVTEIYFEAVGSPGDETELALNITSANDASGESIECGHVPGLIRILDDRPPAKPPVVVVPPVVIGNPPGTGHGPGDGHGGDDLPPKKPRKPRTALDAYIALLMSVQRREIENDYDVDQDNSVTSRDSTRILQDAANSAGEGR